MKKLFMPMCFAAVLTFFSACGTTGKALSSLDALNGEWKITQVEGQNLTAQSGEKEAFMGFDVKENRLYGCTGCNNLLGGLQADAKKHTISFGQTGSTRMMCENMETEQKVLGAMAKVEKYEISANGVMLLKAADGTTVMTLQKK